MSTPHKSFKSRARRACYLNANPRVVDAYRLELETKLKLLPSLSLHTLSSLDDPAFAPCDLLVVAAHGIAVDSFAAYLDGLARKLEQRGQIAIPALVVASCNFTVLAEIFEKAVQSNWYFDIVEADHISSLPIRAANLLRIHDHLHELGRYENTLNNLSVQAEELSREIKNIKKGES